jgi:hypothetical protein
MMSAKITGQETWQELRDKLEAENGQLREALTPFAALDVRHMTEMEKAPDHPVFGLNATKITLGDILRARAAVEMDCAT